MLKVLINAYACSPNKGSEPGLGWNWCVHLAKYCELFIITEGEFRDQIEAALPYLPQGNNMHFYYNPVSVKVRNLCWNQGSWLFYVHYRKWQKEVLAIAKKICEENSIDIIHQLNMTGYREPGYLWKIKGPKYVWGPLGGTSLCPINYIKGIDPKTTLKYRFKNILNWLQFRLSPRVKKAAKKADLVFCDSNSGVLALKQVYGVDSIQINEAGCMLSSDVTRERIDNKDTLDILWCGRFLPTKLLDLSLRSIALVNKDYRIKLHILGGGSFESKYRAIEEEVGVKDRCEWHGLVPHEEVQRIMRSSDLLFYPSVVDGTPASIMECISNHLPILCFDTCGFGPMVDSSIGMKVQLSNPKQSAQDFAEKIEYLYENRNLLQQMSDNCESKTKNISWDSQAERLFGIYNELLKK